MKSIASTPHLISPDLPLQANDSVLKLAVLASGNGSNFEAIVQAIADGKLRAEIPILIYNNPGAAVAARAQRWGIPALLMNHRDYQSREAFDFEIAQTLKQYGVDWIVMAGWMRVVTQVLIEAFPNRVINIHPSLLPSFPGIRAIEQALKAGVKIAGCTVHIVTLEVDNGPILMQAAVPVFPDDTPETLHARVQIQEHEILPRAIALVASQAAKS
ncbi:MAG TPA: phosphoribosylglycinamide formyltransferase [Oscillatoriales cyanobacterium M59_W2019_021]|nr:MAG: phosphoribosylglycinamide formyltransferase [Cyanobacteria bacterium J055]HIK32302.1 phosphoribosylglycinamide formyltransferase [Oscillatoriales cyanobacterium M4454_W2019_049]HIK53255.1 phosphoribosylglycinamide formyltransferase [Oscillatoriales cyanobacterium M59_W2019_021]